MRTTRRRNSGRRLTTDFTGKISGNSPLVVKYNIIMNTTTYDVLALEEIAKEKFDFSVEIQSIILPMSDVGRTAAASVFLTSKNHLAVYVEVSSAATLADIKKIVRRMGLKVEEFLPPKGQPNYFDDIGRERFQSVFPGMKIISSGDLLYYRTLAPYNPALGIISEVKNGEIYQFDPDARGGWRVGARFRYKRIQAD